jgi:hypothetical protein
MRVSSWHQSRLIYDFDSIQGMDRFQGFLILFEKLELIRLEPSCYYTDYQNLQIIFDQKEFNYL